MVSVLLSDISRWHHDHPTPNPGRRPLRRTAIIVTVSSIPANLYLLFVYTFLDLYTQGGLL